MRAHRDVFRRGRPLVRQGLLGALAVLGSCATLTASNLVLNPGFESYTESYITNWRSIYYAPLCTFDIATDTSRSGDASLFLDWPTDDTSCRTSFVSDQQITNAPNQQYRISLWVRKSDPDQYYRFDFQLYDDPDGSHLFRTQPWWQTDEAADPTEWQEWTCENVIFCEDVTTIGLLQYFGYSQGTIWVDDVSVTEMEDSTFPLTDLSVYDPPAAHPMLWDPATSLSNIALCGESALIIDAVGTERSLTSARNTADNQVMSNPGWTSGWDEELGTLDPTDTAYWLRYVAHLYVLTGEAQYLDKVTDELSAWAGVFGTEGSNVTSRVTESTLNEQRFVLYMSEAFDNVFDGLSVDDRQTIETDFIRPLLRNMNSEFGARNNRSVRGTSVTAMAGLVLQDLTLLRKAFHSLGAIDYMLRYNVDSNGGWLGDASSGYVVYTFGMLDLLLERAWHSGLNLYQSDGMAGLLKFIPRIRFPNGYHPAYGDASLWADYSEWEPYETFQAREPGLAAFDVQSELFPGTGYAMLREGEGSEEVYAGFTYGLGASHGHADRLGLILYGSDQVMAPDGGTVGYSGEGSEIYFPYLQKPVSHNLVTVDEECFQKGGRKHLHFFASSPRISVVSASTDDHYEGVLLHRTLAVTRGYVLDLFRCSSAAYHRYDWILNNEGDVSLDRPLQRRRGPVGFTGGYLYVPGEGSVRTQDTWSATWDVGLNRGLRLLMSGGSTTEIITGESPRGARDLAALFARRRATNTCYVVALDPFLEQPMIQELAEVRSTAGRDAGVGAAVTRTNGFDILVLGCAAGRQDFVDSADNPVVTLDGDFGGVSWEQAVFDVALLVNGVVLECSEVSVTSSPAATVCAQKVSNTVLRVENLGTNAATVTVSVGTDTHTGALSAGTSFDMAVTSAANAPVVSAACWPADATESTGPPSAGGPIPTGVNLVTNPGMELAEAGAPVGWEPLDLYPGTDYCVNDVTYDTNTARTGTCSLRMNGGHVYSDHTEPGAWVQTNILDHGSNTSFRSTAWVKAGQDTQVRLCLYGYEPGWGKVADGAISDIFTVGTNWTQITHYTTFGPGVTEISLVLMRCSQWQGGVVWFDDVNVAAVDPADLPPEVENLDPSDITWNSAVLNGNLFSTGGAPSTVWVYWGGDDGGTSRIAWATNACLGVRAEGVFSNKVNDLAPDTAWYARCMASNLNGQVWAQESVSFATAGTNEYVWTGASDARTWSDQANWQPDDAWPDDSGDKATIPPLLAHAIHTEGAVTIGELEMEAGGGASITLGGAFTVSTAGVQTGGMTIEAGSFLCNGHDLTVDGAVALAGTLDAHTGGDPAVALGDLHILQDGDYKATAGTTVILCDFKNEGRFRHNQGTIAFKAGTHSYVNKYGLSSTGENAFYNFTGAGDGFSQVTSYGSMDIEHDLVETGTTLQLRLAWNGSIITFGTDEVASQVDITYFDASGGYAPITVQAADAAYPVVFNPSIKWLRFFGEPDQAGYMSHAAHARWVDVRKPLILPTNGTPKTLTLDGECRFAGVTIGAGNRFVTGSQDATFTGTVHIAAGGVLDAEAGTLTMGHDFTNNGTFACGACTVLFTNKATVDNYGQGFYNLTCAAGEGNRVTLLPGMTGAVSNLLHVVSGTCTTLDNLSQPWSGTGTFVPLAPGVNTVFCGVSPLVESGAVLEAGREPPAGSLFKLW